MAEDASVKAKPVNRLLQQFSHGIVSTTREANRRDLVKKHQARSKKEDQKWHNRYDLFAPLADLRRRNLAGNEKKTAKSDSKLHEIKYDHRDITGQLASTLGAGGTGVEKFTVSHTPADPKAIESIESNQRKFEHRLRSIDEGFEHRFRSIDEGCAGFEKKIAEVQRSTVPNATIRAMEKNAADLVVNADKVEKTAKRSANLVSQLEKNAEKVEKTANHGAILEAQLEKNAEKAEKTSNRCAILEARLEKLEHGVKANETSINQTRDEITAHNKDLQTLQGSYKDHIDTVSDLKRTVDQDNEGLRVLREVVEGGEDGDSKERSLFDMIIDAQKDDSKLREAINGLDSTINDVEDGVKEIKAQVTNSETAKANLEIRLNTLEDERSGSDLQSELTWMKEQLSVLSEEVKKVVNEQHVKDDMVATEVERLDNELIRQANNAKVLSEKLETAPSKGSTEPPSDLVPEASNTHPQLANGILEKHSGDQPNTVHQLELNQESIKQDFDGLQSSFERFKNLTADMTSTHDVCINSLQQRFDNLTTDHMVRAMINQLQSLYPNHPGNLVNQVNQLAVNQRHFFDSISQVSRQYADLEKTVRTNQDHVVPLINQGCEKVEKVIQNRLDAQNAGRIQLRESIKSDMEQRLQVLNDDNQETSSVIKQDLEAQLNRIQNMQKSRNEHATAISALKKNLQDIQQQIMNQSEQQQPPPPPPAPPPSTFPSAEEFRHLANQLAEMRDNIVRELTMHYEAIRILNAQCGLSNAALVGDADDDSPNNTHTHNTQSSTNNDDGKRARSASISLGQPSSPPTPSTPRPAPAAASPAAQLTAIDGAASDSDPPVSNTSNRKRRGRPRKEETGARARKVSKMGS
ncbi:MAG: hypothetical protein Q9191_006268 [Dirinaria sp. TL-2023a]